jgi:acyl carrier protein
MSENEVWQRLTAIFREVFDDDEIEIGPETTAEDIEDWDSLSNIQLLVAIERSFKGLKFNTGEVANLQNVGEMVAIITKRIGD